MLSLARGKEGSFKLVSGYKPEGDQPAAIESIVANLNDNVPHQVLLGVTGSGKTFTMANVIAQREPADARDGAEQDARRAALQRVQEPVPGKRGPLLRLVLRLLPARGVRSFDRHVYRERREHQRRDRQAAPFRDQGAARAQRRADRGVGLVHLRPRRARGVLRDAGVPRRGADHRSRPDAAQAGRYPVSAQRLRFSSRDVSGARRHRRDFPGVRRAARGAGRVFRRRGRGDLRDRPAARQGHPQAAERRDLSGVALRDDLRSDGNRGAQYPHRAEGAPRVFSHRESAAGSAAPRAAHDVRPRAAGRDGLLPRNRKLLAPSDRTRCPDRRRRRCSTTSRTIRCSSSTRAT